MPSYLDPLDIVAIQIPHYFRCPVSLDLMCDPVTVSTGHSYDRSSIESWLATGNTTCPVTRLPLTDISFIPNHTLRRLIQDWCVANRSLGVERIPTPKLPADPALVRSLLSRASSGSGPQNRRIAALRRLRALARESDKNRTVIAASGAGEKLFAIAFEDSGELSHEAIGVLSVLGISEPECGYVARDSDRVRYLVSLLFHPSIDVRVSSTDVIEAVVAGIRSPEMREQISGADGVFDGVVAVLNYPLAYPRATKAGIKALFALCLSKQHRHRAVEAGAAEALVGRLAELEKSEAERALATVELLCRVPSGYVAFEKNEMTVPLLVSMVVKVSERATEYAAGALVSLCSASEKAKCDAVAAGVVSQLMVVVQSGCTERGKRKAQVLLKLLRNAWPHEVKSSGFPGNNVVLL